MPFILLITHCRYLSSGPTAASRSPPKPTSTNNTLDDSDPPALVRFARLKQQQTTGASPHPEKWTVKDTSVQIASAFHQAASTSLEDQSNGMYSNESVQPRYPRSTSVEYEKETQTVQQRRYLAPPSRRPLVKENSLNRVVPDSEGEDEQNSRSRTEREKSPFAPLIDTARSLARSAEYFLRPPEDTSTTNGHGQPNTSSSYDYSQEEQDYQQASRNTSKQHRKNRMSTDNKAYRPSMSDLEESDEDFDDDGKRTRRKKLKKGAGAGPPLTSLPVAGYDKRRRKRKSQRGDGDEGSSEDDSVSQISRSADQVCSYIRYFLDLVV